MDLQRVARNSPVTVAMTFYNGSTTAVNADGTVSVTVKKADGTTLVTGNASGPAANVYTYTGIVPQANLNVLTVLWTGLFGGVSRTETSYVEIVGGFYFTEYELRNYDSALTAQRFPDDKLTAERTMVESEFEDIVFPRAFVPRFWRESAVSIGDGQLILERPEASAITKLYVDGVDKLSWVTSNYVTKDADDVYALNLSGSALAALYATNIEIEYEYGMPRVPVSVKKKALKRAKMNLLGSKSAIDERALTLNVPEFGTMTLATPGMRQSYTGVPDIDATLARYFIDGAAGQGAVY